MPLLPEQIKRRQAQAASQALAGDAADRDRHGAADSAGTAAAPPVDWRALTWPLGIAGAALALTFVWAYWPTMVDLVQQWDRMADYSHGYLVAPFAIYLLWARRDRFPGWTESLVWPGLALIVISIALRVFGARFFLKAVDTWSMLFWLAGVIWFLGGWRVMWWSLPSVAFLWFMIPLPFRAERWLSLPLQKIATKLSCWCLQCLGQKAIAEGHTIVLCGDAGVITRLDVAEACSGLRVFVGITALAFAYLIVVRRSWWERLFLLASVVPVALIANATRIVVTAFLYIYASGEAARKFSHDSAGWAMIVLAAGLFALVLWYLKWMVREEQSVEMRDTLRREQAAAPAGQ